MGSNQATSPGARALGGATGWKGCATPSSPAHYAQDHITAVYKPNTEAS